MLHHRTESKGKNAEPAKIVGYLENSASIQYDGIEVISAPSLAFIVADVFKALQMGDKWFLPMKRSGGGR